tara:strand:+ start:823 stop:969 length:147 start_codon:yes stop_codon:yes gene_type:complete
VFLLLVVLTMLVVVEEVELTAIIILELVDLVEVEQEDLLHQLQLTPNK